MLSSAVVLETPPAASFAPEDALAPPPSAFPPVVWNAPLRDPSGYADEARHFAFALDEAGAAVAARAIAWNDRIARLSPHRERQLQTLLARPQAHSFASVQVSHILAPHFRRDPNARANVGRTMFETDRLPAGWAEACAQMDAVWVPGAFNRETFARAGVPVEKLRVVPGAIDLAPYHARPAPLVIAGARGYNFLSVFDWTLRKGWDVLTQAFVETFRADEDVALILKTHASLGYSTAQIADMTGAHLARLGHDLNRIPDIIFQEGDLAETDMPALYRAADCFVLPTRGEGWGRPFMEAMAAERPVIATDWGGQTAFVTAQNSFLLDYAVVEVPPVAWNETPTYRGHRWAEPSLPHLKQLLRRAFEDREAGRALGQQAHADIEARFTYPRVAAILLEELARLGAV